MMLDFETLLEKEDLAKLRAIISAPTAIFSEIAREAKLNVKTDFKFIDLSEVDFGGSDIRGFNFTGANLARTNWKKARYDSSTIIKDAILDGALGIDLEKFKERRPFFGANRKGRLVVGETATGQSTLLDSVSVSGVGVHSGSAVTLTLSPADDDTGIIFQRLSASGDAERQVRLDIRAVVESEFAIVLGDARGPVCSAAEHLLAALRGLNIDNVIVEIDGPEVPIMDGSAAAFVEAIDYAGLTGRRAPRRYIEIVKPITVTRDVAFGELRPYEHGFRVEAEIEFDHPLVGRQSLSLDIDPKVFRREIARARTFGFMSDVSRLWSAGYALGASLDNTLVVSEDRVLNAEGLRFPDEFVRHKILDAIGDLALAGLPIIGAFKTVRGGHKLNYAVLSALMANTSAWRVVEDGVRAKSSRKKVDAALARHDATTTQERS